MANDTWVTASPKRQSISEAIAYSIDYTDIGTPSAAGTVAAYNATGTDVSTTLLSGSASLASNTVTLKLFTPTTAGLYRLVNTVSISGNTVKGGIEVVVYDPTTSPTVTNGYATILEFRNYARIDNSDLIDDAVIADLIMAASRFIDSQCNRTFYGRTETRYFSVPDGRCLQLDDDLISVTTLTNGDSTVLTTTNYYLWPKNKAPYVEVWLKESSSYMWEMDSSGNTEYVISLVGTWGYSSTAPADVKTAALQIAQNAYKRRFGENVTSAATISAAGIVITPEDVPGAAWTVIRSYRRRL